MLFYLAQPAILLGIIVALLIGIFAHDTAQVLAARLVRDPLPRLSGRLTASLRHRVSAFSVVAMVIAGNGWAQPVPMDDSRKRRVRASVSLLAGPLTYLILAFLALLAYKASLHRLSIDEGGRLVEITHSGGFLTEMAGSGAVAFASMFILSLIPVPPTDGGRLLFLLGPQSEGWRKARYNLTENNYGVVLLLAILLLPVLFQGFPAVVGQLVPPLLRGLSSIVGL